MSLFCKLNLVVFQALYITKWIDRGYLVGETPPTVLYRFFWNFTGVLIMVRKYAFGLDIILRLSLSLFSQVDLSHFSGIIYNKVNGQGLPCGRNSSYSFIPILFWKLHWCFGQGLKICMWLRYNPQIIFVTFCKLNLVVFQALYITKWMDRRYLVGATPPTVLYWFFWNFAGVLVMVRRYACGLDIILRLFLSLFCHISSIIYNKVNGHRDTLWAQLLLQFFTDSFETSLVFWSWAEAMHVVWI